MVVIFGERNAEFISNNETIEYCKNLIVSTKGVVPELIHSSFTTISLSAAIRNGEYCPYNGKDRLSVVCNYWVKDTSYTEKFKPQAIKFCHYNK